MTDAVRDLARRLRAAAGEANQRRLLVLAGAADAGRRAAVAALAGADASASEVTVLTPGTEAIGGLAHDAGLDAGALDVRPTDKSGSLLGTTRDAVVLDCHGACEPNALGRAAGAVDGGGLLVLVTPPLDDWPDRRDGFDEGLAVPPATTSDVSGRFRGRLVDTLRTHPGVAVYDVDAGNVLREGTVDHDPPPRGDARPSPPRRHAFPAAAYEACLTADQSRAVNALEALQDPGEAVVVEADRGRGKSSAAGLAAGALAADGRDVLVTAPAYRNAAEVFERARELLDCLGLLDADASDDRRLVATEVGRDPAGGAGSERDDPGRVRFARPPDAAALPDDPDAVVVDEAAAVPVRLLVDLLDAPSAAFCTTVRGYEGAGRGFSVRFRDHLAAADRTVTDLTLDEPIRYARGDPVESWLFRALLLDARPPVDDLVADANPETVDYAALSPDDLLADEHRLREAFGLLVLAHYRTEPNDLARLLDAPNLVVRALLHDGRVVAVALLAREGGLDEDTRRRMYEGSRVRGNMLPDVLTSQLRDEGAGVPVGYRVVRIATHHAVRSRGLGSHLLDRIRAEVSDAVDWLGVGYGATPELLDFWRANGFRTAYLSTSRNDASGEHSAVMLSPTSERGRTLAERHVDWFVERTPATLADAHRDLGPDVVRGALRATETTPAVDLSERAWRLVVDAADGPGLYSVDPRPFRHLALRALTDPSPPDLDPREERLLVRKVLQGREWEAVAAELDYVSTSGCMKSLGRAYGPILDRYAPDFVQALRDRYLDDGGSAD